MSAVVSTAGSDRFDVAAMLARLGVSPRRITADSRQVRTGDAFAAFPGLKVDGRAFIPDAITRGAGAILWEAAKFKWKRDWKVANAAIEGLQHKLGHIADFIYGSPSGFMWMVGVTGTNGKTTCAQAIAQCLQHCGQRAAVMGTLGNGFVGDMQPATHTTPDAAALHEQLAQYRQRGAKAVAMEVSSHGLDQGRVNGIEFDIALFTNLSRDHLDYHGTMSAYGAAKARLFAWPGLHACVINRDDAFGQSLADSVRARGAKVLTYGFSGADIAGSNLRATPEGITFTVNTPWGRAEVTSRLIGAFNASNLLGVLGVLLTSGIAIDKSVEAIVTVEPPRGRMQRFGGGDAPLVIVDYAHTPDALEKALTALRPITQKGRELVCVFGCGGDRDAGKRPQMGRIAAQLADRVIVTNDNPRTEDPSAIAETVLHGIRETANRRWALELDRAAAIAMAISKAQPGDVVLIAGKGHEDYQDRNGVREHFSDAEEVETALGARSAA
ncbi:MAG TPA: UDP-N-acetylmuramoyl-L-alanyl-D-glutamate--2,6-diaminopimelate ligase [Casimicrobiaceae bacterium]|nr:UDP-N-acetylmuramoyl-L-alanyl-D-glutamate--2,6-diaminopimelate ligase [Casimicrobiaceae bacterium]